MHEPAAPTTSPPTETTLAIAALLMTIATLAGRDADQVEGLDAAEAARLLGVSISKFRQLDATGFVPSPILLGNKNCPRWSRMELLAHFRAGAPHRKNWLAMRDRELRRMAG